MPRPNVGLPVSRWKLRGPVNQRWDKPPVAVADNGHQIECYGLSEDSWCQDGPGRDRPEQRASGG